MEKLFTLKNGVEVFENGLENNFAEAQRILDENEYTAEFDAYSIYNERLTDEFEKTFKVKVARSEDYQRFIERMHEEKRHRHVEEMLKRSKINVMYLRGLITADDAYRLDQDSRSHAYKPCHCEKCVMRIPNIEEWKSGKYTDKSGRTVKLGKAMKKAGFSKELLDFYSQQIKTEKDIYFTITGTAQHIAGMSYYAEIDSWDGYNGTSCQDPRHYSDDSEYIIKLAGSLHDNKLFVGMLHESMDDLDDMTDKLLARTMLRYVTIDNVPCLIATSYYGNNATKDMMNYCLNAINEMDVYSNKVLDEGSHTGRTHNERANGYLIHEIVEDIEVSEWMDEEVKCDCPLCNGSGTHEVYADRAERWVSIDCPACSGSGTHYASIVVDVCEDVEVITEVEIRPYNEGYEHYGFYTKMYIDSEVIRKSRDEYGISCSRGQWETEEVANLLRTTR